ncbi:zinc ribbon domain-containing protein [Bacillus cereus]
MFKLRKHKNELQHSNRIYKCNCSHEIDRELNASINLSQYELVS